MGSPRTFLAGFIIEASLIALVFSGNLIENRERFLFYFLAFAGYLYAARLGVSLPFVLGFALLFRITLLFSYPSLTTDIYRYYWDGKLVAHGFNPYLYPPASEELAALRGEYYDRVVYKHVATIYPPFAQLVFAFSYLIYPSLFTLKLASVLFDLAAVGMLVKLLELKGMERERVILYAWNPLVVVEFASSGHADAMAVFFVLLAYYLYLRDKPLPGGAALGLGVLSKLYPLLLVPFFLRGNPRFLPGFLGVLALFYLPFLDAGMRLLEGLEVFLRYAKFNPGAFYLLEFSLGFPVAKHLALVLVALGCLLLLRGDGLVRRCYLILTLYLVFSPMVHPWYVSWGLSLALILNSYAWVAFSALVGLSYLLVVRTPQGMVWVENPLVTLAQYLPFYGFILWELRRKP